jgi:hypothetical protein
MSRPDAHERLRMGHGGVQMFEAVIGCTLAEAFTLLSGRGVLSTNCPPAQEDAAQPHTWKWAGRRRNRSLAGRLERERMKGLEPSTFCMASRRSSQLSYIRARRAV